jgi:hypothetical protein
VALIQQVIVWWFENIWLKLHNDINNDKNN